MGVLHLCARSGGDNLNAGSRNGSTTVPGTAADFTYTGGSWDATTDTFTVASGDPASDGVAANDLVSIYTAGATVATFIARVTSVTSTTIVVSTTLRVGSEPATGTRTLKVGGAWAGFTTGTSFPYTLSSWENLSDDRVQINFMNDQTYDRGTTGLSMSGAVIHSGFTSAYDDGGLVDFTNAVTGGAGFTLGTSQAETKFIDFECTAASGTADFVVVSGGRCALHRCVIHGARGSGLSASGTTIVTECEIYGNNTSNSSGKWGASFTGSPQIFDCTIHHNTGTNAGGVTLPATATMADCRVADNGHIGISLPATSNTQVSISRCDVYGNGASGIALTSSSFAGGIYVIRECIISENGGYGIENVDDAKSQMLFIARNNAFYDNVSGNDNFTDWGSNLNKITLTGTPYTDAANGDFSLNNTAGAGADVQSILTTGLSEYASYGPILAYRDLGSLQHEETVGPSGGGTVGMVNHGAEGLHVGA